MTLREIQLLWDNPDYRSRKALEASASIVQPVFLAELGSYESGKSRKIVVTVAGRDSRTSAIPSRAPSGQDGDDVELVTTGADLPDDFADLPVAERRQAALDALCTGLAELATVRGWAVDPLTRTCERLRDTHIEYRWSSTAVPNASKSLVAQAHGEIRETGAWFWAEIRDPVGGRLIASTPEEQLKGPHYREFGLRAGRIRWTAGDRVEIEPKTLRGVPSGYRPIVLDIPAQ